MLLLMEVTLYTSSVILAVLESLQEIEVQPGVIRKGTDMVVNGMDVFGFAVVRPPKSL